MCTVASPGQDKQVCIGGMHGWGWGGEVGRNLSGMHTYVWPVNCFGIGMCEHVDVHGSVWLCVCALFFLFFCACLWYILMEY